MDSAYEPAGTVPPGSTEQWRDRTFIGDGLDELQVTLPHRHECVSYAEGRDIPAARSVRGEPEIPRIGCQCGIKVLNDNPDMVDALHRHAEAPSIGSALYWIIANGTPLVPPLTVAIFAPGWTAFVGSPTV